MPSYFDEQMLEGFRDEMRKIAFTVPWQAMKQGLVGAGQAVQRGAGAVGTGAGMGAVGGGLLGAGIGGYRRFDQSRQQGAGIGESLGAGVGGAAKGGLIGAGAGAVAGGVGGGVAHSMGKVTPELLQQAKQVPVLGHGAGFGQSQAHLLTGWTPKGGIQELGIGASHAQGMLDSSLQRSRDLAKAQGTVGSAGTVQHLQHALATAAPEERPHLEAALGKLTTPAYAPEQRGVWGSIRRGVLGHEGDTARRLQSATNEQKRLRDAVEAGQHAETLGMTNIPGYMKSFASHPLDTLGTAFKQRWNEQGTAGKALMLGLPLGMGAYDVAREDPEHSRAGRAVSAAGNTLGSFAFAPMNMVGDMAMGTALGVGAGRVGKGIDRVLGHKPPGVVQPNPNIRRPGTDQEEHNLGGPVERIETSRFRGEAPEGGIS
jgi:hypothetical protein